MPKILNLFWYYNIPIIIDKHQQFVTRVTKVRETLNELTIPCGANAHLTNNEKTNNYESKNQSEMVHEDITSVHVEIDCIL
ncbi:MAG: hypothetical protein HXS48_22650 [Theionarchaea archaeon]|nr:hypothetical protein [Theionarchaea archaeon]